MSGAGPGDRPRGGGYALDVRQSLLHSSRRAGKGRKALLSRPAVLAERIERAHSLDPVVHSLSDSVVRALPACRVPTPCTACRSASLRIPRWSGCRSAAGAPRCCSTCSAAPSARQPSSSRPASPAPRRPRPPAWPTGRRCTRTSSGSAWYMPSARPGPPPCSSARWPPGPAAGPAPAGPYRRPGSPWPASAPTSAGTWRFGSARAPATPNRSATCPGWAGTICAGLTNCPTGARYGASLATCPCWCTGRAARSACCQTVAPISEDPSTRAGSWWSGALPASPVPGTDPPSSSPTAPSCTGLPPPASHPSRLA